MANDAPSCKKIIATTDSSLGVVKYTEGGYVINGGVPIPLPQPSQGFIQKYIDAYNSRKPIEKAIVEYNRYERHFPRTTTFSPLINPKDNTITISKVKNNWDRNEVKK